MPPFLLVRVLDRSPPSGRDEQHQHPRGDQRSGHQQESGTGVPGSRLQYAHQPRTSKPAERSAAVDERQHLIQYCLRNHLGDEREEGSIRRIHRPTGNNQRSIGSVEIVLREQEGCEERSAGEKQERPHDRLAP